MVEEKTGGTWEEIKGKGKKAVGDIKDDPSLRREGEREERMGEIRQEKGSLERERGRHEEERESSGENV